MKLGGLEGRDAGDGQRHRRSGRVPKDECNRQKGETAGHDVFFLSKGQSTVLGDGERTIPARHAEIENSWYGACAFYFSLRNKGVTGVTARWKRICEMTDA